MSEAQRCIEYSEVMHMGYRIEYDDFGGKYEISQERHSRFPLLLTVCVIVFVLGTAVFWPEGTEKLREWIIPGEDGATAQAFEIMRENLRNGVPVGEAVEAFCRHVIHGA